MKNEKNKNKSKGDCLILRSCYCDYVMDGRRFAEEKDIEEDEITYKDENTLIVKRWKNQKDQPNSANILIVEELNYAKTRERLKAKLICQKP